MSQKVTLENALSAKRSLRTRIYNLEGNVPITEISSFSEDIINVRGIYRKMEDRLELATVSIPNTEEMETARADLANIAAATEKREELSYLCRELEWAQGDLVRAIRDRNKSDKKFAKKDIKRLKKQIADLQD